MNEGIKIIPNFSIITKVSMAGLSSGDIIVSR
jgi:hypothetical protein